MNTHVKIVLSVVLIVLVALPFAAPCATCSLGDVLGQHGEPLRNTHPDVTVAALTTSDSFDGFLLQPSIGRRPFASVDVPQHDSMRLVDVRSTGATQSIVVCSLVIDPSDTHQTVLRL